MSNYLVNRLCKQKEFFTKDYNKFCEIIHEEPRLHRKQAEFFWIYQALKELKMLKKGKSGLGFAVGHEPLPALFASYGCKILATDLDAEDSRSDFWKSSNQHCSADALNERAICPKKEFRKLVSYRPVDMNNIPDDLGVFDFVWSSCSMEHLSSIENGMKFFANSLELLNPGGVAIHTTEINLSHEHMTLDYDPTTIIFRKKDIEQMLDDAREKGYEPMETDWDPGDMEFDKYVDKPPYCDAPHLKLDIGGFTSTSIILIVRKPE